jgi:hypothetical protein
MGMNVALPPIILIMTASASSLHYVYLHTDTDLCGGIGIVDTSYSSLDNGWDTCLLLLGAGTYHYI